MPDLDTKIHTAMLKNYVRDHSLPVRVARAIRAMGRELSGRPTYGMHWGDPETVPPLRFVRDEYLLPYVKPGTTAVEIGPGGGRWTRYLLGAGRLYVVEYYADLLEELRRNVRAPNVTFVKNNGTDFPGVPDASVDFLFTFGTFVHLDLHLIEGYLANMRRILKPDADAVLHYADKNKVMARRRPGFSENDPEKMRKMVLAAGFRIAEEDVTTLWHSSLMRVKP